MKTQRIKNQLRLLRRELGDLSEREQCLLGDVCDILGLGESAIREILGPDNVVTTPGLVTLPAAPAMMLDPAFDTTAPVRLGQV